MLPFWPFRKQPTKWQQLQQTLNDVAAGAGHAIHEVQDSAGEALQNVAATVGSSVSHVASGASEFASNLAHKTATTSADAAHTVAQSASNSASFLKSRGADVAESTRKAAVNAKNIAAKTTLAAQEKALQSVENTADVLTDKFSDVGESVAETASAQTARLKKGLFIGKKRAAETVANIAETSAQKADAAKQFSGERLSAAAEVVGERVENASETVRETSHSAHENVLKLAAAIASAAVAARGNAQERAGETVAHIKDSRDANESDEAVREEPIGETKAKFNAKLKESREQAARRARAAADRYTGEPTYDELRLRAPQVVVEEGASKWLWLALGVLVGALAMLLLAPNSGRRSRAALRDKLGRAGKSVKKAGKSTQMKAASLEKRVEGKLHQHFDKSEDTADDITIADRVRTALGENAATRNMERLNVDCVDGLVTLRGPMVDGELQKQIETIVRAVRGVVDVKSDLLLSDSPEDEQTFVG